MGLHVVLGLFSRIPLGTSLVGVVAHAVYWMLLRAGKHALQVDFYSPQFAAAVVAIVVHHYFVFSLFSSGAPWYPFDQVLSYFTLGVWLVPFTLFISLTANDYTLPFEGTADGACSAVHML